MRARDQRAREALDAVLAGEALDAVLAGEALPWPDALTDYAGRLVTLAIRCATPTGKAEVYRWLVTECAGLLQARSALMRRCRRDALHDAVVSVEGLLLRFRSGLDRQRPPSLRSMLRQRIIWRARDLALSETLRHDARRFIGAGEGVLLANVPAPDDPFRRVLAGEVWAMLGIAGLTGQALRWVGLGETIGAAAARAGVSRQSVYRLRRALGEQLGGSSGL